MSGELDMAVTGRFLEAVQPAIDENRDVTLDLSELTFLDSSGVQAFAEAGCDLVLLAGYDQLLRPPYFAAYRGATINIHPSLLPRHGGQGMMGLAVHRSVLTAGDPESGVSIHWVTPDLDAGPILAQARVPVLEADDADSLARRVLEVEHRLLVDTMANLAAQGCPISHLLA